jgi:hypothetical protein
MARTEINYQQIARTGLEAVYTAAVADGAKFANDGRMFVDVVNGSASSINVTVQTPVTVDGLAVADLVVAVPAGESRKIGPFPPGYYNQTDGMVYVDYSAVTDVTVALMRL